MAWRWNSVSEIDSIALHLFSHYQTTNQILCVHDFFTDINIIVGEVETDLYKFSLLDGQYRTVQ